jgi:hypothetical protein
LERLGESIGSLVETHTVGLSRAELRRRFAEGGKPSVAGFLRFCRELFQVELTPQQIGGAAALVGHPQVLVIGGHGVGKDVLAATWGLYELTVLGAEVLLSGPTDRQVHEVLMRREIARYWSRAAGQLRGQRFERAIRLPGAESPDLIAFTATDPDRFQGHHAARLFIGLTEGQGLDSAIVEAAQKCLPVRLLATCNPTTPLSAAYALSRSPEWHVLTWPATDHPNVVERRVVIPGAVTFQDVERWRREKGETSRFYKVAVLAQWPEETASPLCPNLSARWDDAVARGPEVADSIATDLARFARRAGAIAATPSGPRPRAVLAADIAGAGADQTAVVLRVGWCVWTLWRWREPDTQRNAERIHALVRDLLGQGFGVEAVVLDEIGEGRGVFDRFARLVSTLEWWEVADGHMGTRRVELMGFKSSHSAEKSERYANRRAEVFDSLADQLSEGRLAIHPAADRELVAALREELFAHEVRYQPDDRLIVAPKDDVKRAIGRSPDLADALAMSAAPAVRSAGPKKRQARVLG